MRCGVHLRSDTAVVPRSQGRGRQTRGVRDDVGIESPVAHPLQDRQFRWFFLGRLVSMTGSSMVWVALTFAILEASGSAGDLGVVLAAYTVPLGLFQLFGGALADRFSRSAVLVTSHLGAALTQGAMATLLLTGWPSSPVSRRSTERCRRSPARRWSGSCRSSCRDR